MESLDHRDYWDATWKPILEDALSNQRLEDVMNMQNTLIHLQLINGAQGGWEQEGGIFSVRGAFAEIKEGQFDEE